MPPKVFKADEELEGLRLTKAVSLRVEGISIRRAKELVDWGRVFVNERRILIGSTPLYSGDIVEVHLQSELSGAVLRPEAILWETSDILVINKPAGLSVYGSHGVTEDTLLPLLEEVIVGTGRWHKGDRLTLVHRLDRDTTGVLLVARGPGIARAMEGEFRSRAVEKRYLVLAAGSFIEKSFEERSAVQARRVLSQARERPILTPSVISRSSRGPGEAVTTFKVLEAFPGCALLEAIPETGRTHQIRIHLARIGHPVLGDIRYGPKRIQNPLFREIPRQMLHARSLGFKDPRSGEWKRIEAPLPKDMEDILKRLRSLPRHLKLW